MIRLMIGVAASLLVLAPASAQPSPSLNARIDGIEDDRRKQPDLAIARMNVEVRIHGAVAELTIETQFANPSDDDVEGEYRLALPPGAVVTGYALDVEGRMLDGVLADRERAKAAYEDKVRQGIDPGLAEITRDNVFSTRVFPILAGKGRTIRVRLAVPIDAVAGLIVPLESVAPVGALTIRTSVTDVATPPRIVLPAGLALDWERGGDGWSGSARAKAKRLSGALRIEPVAVAAPVTTSRHANGARFVQIVDTAPPVAVRIARPERVRIYWDRSLSRRDDALGEELALLEAWLGAVKPRAVDVVRFAAGLPETRSFARASDVRRFLEATLYRGGTSYARLDVLPLSPADQCILFGDGQPVIERATAFRPDCVLHTVASAREADRGALARLARANGGQALSLGGGNRAALVQRLLTPPPPIARARDGRGRALDLHMLDGGANGWRAIGEAPADGAIVLTLAGRDGRRFERRYRLDPARDVALDAPGALWAADRIGALAENPRDIERLRALARSHSVANPAMAFVVLEDADDYVEAGIAPPASYPASLMAQYRAAKTEFDEEAAEDKADRLGEVVALWDERKEWWRTRFDRGKRPRERAEEEVVIAPPPPPAMEAAPPPAQFDSPSPIAVVGGDDDAGAIIVTSMRAVPRTTVEIAPFASDRPYLKALDVAPASRRLAVLAAEEKSYGQSPAFYLDTAAWFAAKGDRATAAELLLSALELASANAETQAIVASRLLRQGDFARAIDLLEVLNVLGESRPQPRRALALALAKRGTRADLERAVALLAEVALTPWDGDFDGIETVALMEANALLPKLRRLGGRAALDRRLVALLDTDLRIVIEWTSDDADLDLWVNEPKGERASYSNQETAIGGLVSNDMTDGYGPEEYVIRRAPDGKYLVRVDGYSADRLNPNGTSRVVVRLIRDFGRANELEEIVDAELTAGDGEDDIRLIATFTVGR